MITDNNANDAFKHAFLSASLYFRNGNRVAEKIGNMHESHNLENKADVNESIMDLYNNKIGREIAKSIEKKYRNQSLTEKQLEDIIASELADSLERGDLITEIDDPRIIGLKQDYKGISKGSLLTGIRENLKNAINTEKETLNKNKTFGTNEFDVYGSLFPNQTYENLDIKDKVFYKEMPPLAIQYKKSKDVTKADKNEYTLMERQWQNNGRKLPSKAELDLQVKSGELIYVQGYTKQNGERVEGYFRRPPSV